MMNPTEQNSDEIPVDEQVLFRELIAKSHLNDSVDANHQNALRREVLRTFDRSLVTASVVTPVIIPAPKVGRTLFLSIVVAVCLFLVVAVSFTDSSDPHDGDTSDGWVQVDQMIDAELLGAIEEVNALADEIPRVVFFTALAMCRQEHEALRRNANDARMHWYNESSLLPVPAPVESSKG